MAKKYKNSYLVQLATHTKRNVSSWAKVCLVVLNGNHVNLNFNIFPLGSYYFLIRMDYLDVHRESINFVDETVAYTTDNGET